MVTFPKPTTTLRMALLSIILMDTQTGPSLLACFASEAWLVLRAWRCQLPAAWCACCQDLTASREQLKLLVPASIPAVVGLKTPRPANSLSSPIKVKIRGRFSSPFGIETDYRRLLSSPTRYGQITVVHFNHLPLDHKATPLHGYIT